MRIFTTILVLLFSTDLWLARALAQGQVLDEGYNDAFVNYLPRVVPSKKPEKPEAKPAAAPKPTKPKDEQIVDVEWLKKNYPIIEQRAVDNPSPENVKAYLYVKRILVDKATRFQMAVREQTDADPLINENSVMPYAGAGAQAIRNASYHAQDAAVKHLSKTAGLLVFVDSTCRFCSMQMPVINMLKSEHGIESLVISLDGNKPSGYKGPVVKDNGLYRRLGLKLTPSVVLVPNPRAVTGEEDPNAYLVVAQGFYSADSLAKQIAYAGHRAKILPTEISRDLAVWDYGIANSDDLRGLRVSPDDPKDVVQKLQPLLMRSFEGQPRER